MKPCCGAGPAPRAKPAVTFAWFDQHFRTYDGALALCMSKGSHLDGPGIPAVG